MLSLKQHSIGEEALRVRSQEQSRGGGRGPQKDPENQGSEGQTEETKPGKGTGPPEPEGQHHAE